MRQHIVVIHRSRGPLVPYFDCIDHSANVVTYVCAEQVLDRIPAYAAAEVLTSSSADDVASSVRDLASRHGVPHRIVAISEFDLLVAAQLREEFDIAGDRLDHVRAFRDKLLMCAKVAAAGVSLPAFADAPDRNAVLEFAAQHGVPLVVKPRYGATSRDVVVLTSVEELSLLPDLDAEPFLVQRFCPGETGSIDGVWTGTDLGPWRGTRYFHNCLDFENGENSWGTVDIDDVVLNESLADFARSVLSALSEGVPTVFHLELFHGPSGVPQLQFLEVAGRIPGAEFTHLWREVYHYDLVAAAVDIQMGRKPLPGPLPSGQRAGQLLVRPPVAPPCVVTAVFFAVAPAYSPYYSLVPQAGEVIREASGYVGVGASFRFRASSSAQVAAALLHTLAGFHMECVPYELTASERDASSCPTRNR